jgi:hypothetical protein
VTRVDHASHLDNLLVLLLMLTVFAVYGFVFLELVAELA